MSHDQIVRLERSVAEKVSKLFCVCAATPPMVGSKVTSFTVHSAIIPLSGQ